MTRFFGALSAVRAMIVASAALATLFATPLAAAQPGSRSPALWAVRDADTTVWLFGTIHMLPPEVRWFESDVKAAFDGSAELVLEILLPTPEQLQGTLLRRALAPGAPPVAARLPADVRERYAAALAALGIPANAFDPFRSWFAAVTLTTAAAQKAGYDVAQGPEVMLARAAEAAGKPIRGLETFDEQLAILDSMPEAVQTRFLSVTVRQLPDGPGTLGAMVDAWRNGDPDALAVVMNRGLDELPEAAELLLARRNVRWARWIAERMKTPGTAFVAVGAGHLAGRGSVQDELAKLGVRAERVSR